MAKQKDLAFRLLPEWTIKQSEKSLIISGGADAKFEVELEVSEPSFFADQKSSQSFTRGMLKRHDQRVLEELLTAEIVVPVLKKAQKLRVAVMGNTGNVLVTSNKAILVVDVHKPHDIALVLRTTSTYAELLEKLDYQTITTPHLLVDMAFHHTVSIGPLVFPGETACIACLQGRVSTRWGDEQPPKLPKAVNDYSAFVSELVMTELDRINQNDTSLTNKTIAWNFQDRVIKENQLLKVPLCPVCTQNKIDLSGALALPWRKDESISDTI